MEAESIVIGVSGSIAAYKALAVASALVQQGDDVRVILTPAAAKFVSALSFESITHHPVLRDLWSEQPDMDISHIRLAQAAAVLAIVPATAQTLAQLAHGFADNALSATALACAAPLVVAPAMNSRMWRHPATEANLTIIRARGAVVVGPAAGYLAEGTSGEGRLAELNDILAAIRLARIGRGDLEGQTFVVTAGPTQEAIDPVRYLSNRSSGKMGYAIAGAAARRGANVVLISGPTQLQAPPGTRLTRVTSAQEMFGAVQSAVVAGSTLIMAAAVADYRAAAPQTLKIKRISADLELRLSPTVDILGTLQRPPGLRVVAFAAETNDLLRYAQAKLETKRADMLVANDVSEPGAGFDSDSNHVWLCMPGVKPIEIPLSSKQRVADAILDALQNLPLQRS